MKRSISAREAESRWKILKRHETPPAPNITLSNPISDMFDCSDLVVPTSQQLVDTSINSAIQEWKELKQRRVINVVASTNNTNRLKLPESFDYANRQPPPIDNDTNDDINSDRVISLEDPSIQTSFERELWEIFKKVPTVEQLESRLLENAACRHMRTL